MENKVKNSPHEPKPTVVRHYDIGGTRFVVTASVRVGASEDAAAKVRRLIRREIGESPGKQGN